MLKPYVLLRADDADEDMLLQQQIANWINKNQCSLNLQMDQRERE